MTYFFNSRKKFLFLWNFSIIQRKKMNGHEKFDENNSRPVTPTNDDCCGNSCNPCIFDVHKKLLDQWEKRKLQGIQGQRKKNILNPVLYKNFELTEFDEVNEEFIKLRFVFKDNIHPESSLFMNPGQHVILSMNKQSKPYTPISWTRNSIQLLIKVYSNGVFTTTLKRLKIGDEIRVRGPYGDFVYKPNSFRQIVAFCIGSGIAAIYPIARSIVDDESEETRIDLIAGFPSVTRVPLKKELRELSDYWNVNCTLQISNPLNDDSCLNGVKIQQGRLTECTVAKILDNRSKESTLILICGTEVFNESLETWIKNFGYTNYHVFK